MTTDETGENFQVDLTNCDREPIHLLGRVQTYGALIAVSPDWIVQHASENLEAILGIPYDRALGRPINEIIVSDGFDRVRHSLRMLDGRDSVVRLFNMVLRGNGQAYDISLHQSGVHLIFEFEPKTQFSGADAMTEIYPLIASLRRNRGLGVLAREAARALQQLTGFDSVMVYQFQPDHAGKVIAEARLDGQSKYEGMMFPASDIPVQARTLYKRSLLRLIADIGDKGSPVIPPTTENGQPLDLSLAVTRSVSPIHIEYLQNMGIEASMSVSIMKDGELWGLFACHHNSPLYIDYERRTSIELFAHLFSYELIRYEEGERKIAEEKTGRLQTMLLSHMAAGRLLSESLLSVSREIEEVIPHDGLILFENENFHSTGTTPSEEEFRDIALVLDRTITSSIYSTECLYRIHPPALEYADKAAGLMVIPISKRPRDYLVLVRRQIAETVMWAGDPSKPAMLGPHGPRLTPRKSFEVWKETVSGCSKPWSLQERHAANLLRTILLEVFLKVTDAANLERKRAQEQQALLISELNHRVRNILNLMRGLVSQTKSSSRTLEEFTANLDGRIHSLARAHDQLTAEHFEPTSLKYLITCEFEAYADAKLDRVIIEGPDAMLNPRAYTTMALVLHELATNSVKYGALCDQSGQVFVRLKSDAVGALMIEWIESGGPPVSPPKRRGFGTSIIEGSVTHELGGDAEISYKMTGLEARFRVPPALVARFVDGEGPHGAEGQASSRHEPSHKVVKGRGMVLEDTLIIAMDAAAVLEDLGAQDVKILSSVAEALDWLGSNKPDFALLDVNLGEEQSTRVAEKLYKMRVPFVLATGYGATQELIDSYPPCVILQKPYSDRALEEALQSAQERISA